MPWGEGLRGSKEEGADRLPGGVRTVPGTQGLCACPHRGGMIQTAEQYQFLHDTLALYAAQLPGEPSP